MISEDAPSHVGGAHRMPTCTHLSDSLLDAVVLLFPSTGADVSSHAETPPRTPAPKCPSGSSILDAIQDNIKLFVGTTFATEGRPVTLSFSINDTSIRLVKHISPEGLTLLVAIPDEPNPGCYVALDYLLDRSKLRLRSPLKDPASSVPSGARFMNPDVRDSLTRAGISLQFLEFFIPPKLAKQTAYPKSRRGSDVLRCLFVPSDLTDKSGQCLETGFLPPATLDSEYSLLAFFARRRAKNDFFVLPPIPLPCRVPPPQEAWDGDNPDEHAPHPHIRLSAV